MTNNERIKIEKDKAKELRTKEISKMIGEGGLGADNYYNIDRFKRLKIKKEKELRTKEIAKMIGEGGLGADNYYNIEKVNTDRDAKPRNRG